MIHLEPIFEKVKYNALDYIGMYQAPVCELSSVLVSIVEKNGVEILFDTARLADTLRESGITEAEIHRVCLMSQVSGFREVLNRDPRTVQLDLDRYIKNATEETGLNRDTILRITSAIAFVAGISMNCHAEQIKENRHTADNVIILAQAACQEKLAAFRAAFEKVVFKNSTYTVLDFKMLEPFVNYGIPKAKYYLGYCLLKGIQVEENEIRGLELLQEAADAGDSEAASALGDYYFAKGGSDNWTKAYAFYTGYGAAALTRSQKEAVVSILNHKRYNRKLLILCAVFFAALIATVIFAPATAVFAARPFWGWSAIAVQFVLLTLSVMHYKTKPYDCVYALPVAMSAVWFVYMAIRLLF